MSKIIFAANLKCNHTRASFSEYAKILDAGLNDENVLVFPPFTALDDFSNCKFRTGVQNFYHCESGAYTGEIGKIHLDEFNIKSVLIGHCERRELLFESDDLLRAKFNFAVKNGWQIIYCVGENLDVRNSGRTKDFLSSQLKLIDLDYENLIIAYEPIWAIGSGLSASVAQIDEVLSFIATFVRVPLLYGGSVNVKNIAEILAVKDCLGVLVGTASWDAAKFLELIKTGLSCERL